ncbi:hypothetical protein HID58_088515 [Brassica napus]|uniref:Uncharacterized protein n=1 Tax=Brassica napus TaxID=3708 RepID=A0ABQ7XWG4_BRANA|nr:hypothetical protein HID58_088515 [Brassica napus]
MSRMYGNRGREGRGREEGRRYEKKKEDDIIPIPEFDFSDLIEKYKLTLVGRIVARIEQKEIEEKATREDFSIPSRYGTDRTIHLTHTNHRTTTERSYRGVEKKDYRRPVESNRERSSSDLHSQCTISDKLELQRTSRGHLDRSRKSPPKHTKEWRPIRQGKENTEAARVIETEMNDEERRRLKGKMIAQDPTPDQLRPISGRGTLIIREPSSNPPENQTEGVQRSNLGDAIQNGASKKIVETEERHSPRGSEDLELIDPDSEEDGELMDDEAFDRMIEQYTEPEQMTEADIYNVDDLMEEEQDLERTRLAKEATPTTLEEEKSKSIEKSVQNVETTICLPERGEKSAITSQKNDETEIFKNLDQEGHQITAAKKKKKTPRSPDVKGTAASKKLALRCQVDASWTHEDRKTGLGFVLMEEDQTILVGLQNVIKTPTDTPVWLAQVARPLE